MGLCPVSVVQLTFTARDADRLVFPTPPLPPTWSGEQATSTELSSQWMRLRKWPCPMQGVVIPRQIAQSPSQRAMKYFLSRVAAIWLKFAEADTHMHACRMFRDSSGERAHVEVRCRGSQQWLHALKTNTLCNPHSQKVVQGACSRSHPAPSSRRVGASRRCPDVSSGEGDATRAQLLRAMGRHDAGRARGGGAALLRDNRERSSRERAASHFSTQAAAKDPPEVLCAVYFVKTRSCALLLRPAPRSWRTGVRAACWIHLGEILRKRPEPSRSRARFTESHLSRLRRVALVVQWGARSPLCSQCAGQQVGFAPWQQGTMRTSPPSWRRRGWTSTIPSSPARKPLCNLSRRTRSSD